MPILDVDSLSSGQNCSDFTLDFPADYNLLPLVWPIPLPLPHDWCHHTKGLPLVWVIPLALFAILQLWCRTAFWTRTEKGEGSAPHPGAKLPCSLLQFCRCQVSNFELGMFHRDTGVTHLVPPILGPKIWARTGAPNFSRNQFPALQMQWCIRWCRCSG